MAEDEAVATGCLILADNVTDNLPALCNTTAEDLLSEFTPPLWKADFPVAVLYCVILVVSLLVGTGGNIIIIIVSATTTTMNKVGRYFVINLALSDLCVNMVAEPMCILGVIKGEKWFSGRRLLCEIVAGMCLTACFCAFLSLTVITINKYLFVCWNRIYQKFCKRSVCIIICISCWILAVVFEFPNVIGWGDHYFDKKSHQCIWERTASFSYTMLVSVGFIGVPLVSMGLCFILIFIKIWQTKKDVFKFNHDDPLRMRRVWLESFRTSRTLVVVFFAFLVCWTPYAVITTLDFEDRFPVEVHLFVTLLAHSHSSLNFSIYMTFSASFRQTVRKMFSCRKFPDWKFKNSMDSTSRTTSEFPRSETEATEKLPKKYYLNSAYQPSLVNNLKAKGLEFTPIADEKPVTNRGDPENLPRDGMHNSNGYKKY